MFTLPLYNLLERMKSMLLACLIWLTKLTRLSSKNGSTISSSGWWKGVSERVWRTLKMSWTCSSHGLRNQRERYFLHYILYQSAKLHDELGISDVCKQSDPTRTSFWYRLCLIEKSQIHHEDIRLGKPGQWPLASRCEDRQDLRNQCQKLSYLKTHCNHDATKCYKYLAGTEWRKKMMISSKIWCLPPTSDFLYWCCNFPFLFQLSNLPRHSNIATIHEPSGSTKGPK